MFYFLIVVADELSKMATFSQFPFDILRPELWINFTRNDFLNRAMLSHKHYPFLLNFPYGKHIFFAIYWSFDQMHAT